MSETVLRDEDSGGLNRAFALCKKWAEDHQAEVGIAEMAMGAAILSWGVMNGQLTMGQDIAASNLADIGGLTGIGVGALSSTILATTLLKGVFVGGVGLVAGVTCIPAAVIVGGSAVILGSLGYVVGDKIAPLFSSSFDFQGLLSGASIIAVGTALLIDGARRLVKDERVLALASNFHAGVIKLVPQTTEIVVASWTELQRLVHELAERPSGYAAIGSTTLAGAAIGSTLAAGSVTLLGSSGLGAVALSLGIVSAPVWPIIAGGAAGLTLGVAAWRSIRKYQARTIKIGEAK